MKTPRGAVRGARDHPGDPETSLSSDPTGKQEERPWENSVQKEREINRSDPWRKQKRV